MGSTRATLEFLVLSVVWGSGFVVVKVGQQYFPPVFYAALAFDATAVGLFAYVLLRDGMWKPDTRQSWLAVGAIALFTITVYNAFFFIGQRNAPSAVGAVILSFIPIITAGLVRVLIPDRTFELLEAAGLLVGLLGVVLIIRPTPESFATGDIGRLLILVAAVSNALGAVLVQRIDPPAPTPVLLAWAIPSGGIALHGVSAFVVRESYTNISLALPGLLAVGYLALFVNIMGYLIFFGFLRRVGAFEVSLINYFQPIATAVIGWLILSEQLALSTIGGFCLILFGFLLIKRDSVRQYVVRQDVPF